MTAAASFDSLRASSAPARGEDGRSVTESTQAAGTAFIKRLKRRAENQELISGPAVAQTQMAAFREWEQDSGERFLGLRKIHHPALAVNMIPVSNSYWLSAHLPNAVLLTYPARLAFQFHEPFYRTRCRVPRLGVGVRALLRDRAIAARRWRTPCEPVIIGIDDTAERCWSKRSRRTASAASRCAPRKIIS